MRLVAKKIFLLCTLFCGISAVAYGQLLPVKMACELRNEPLGIDVENPTFSYVIKAGDNRRGVVQTAYQVIVAGTPDFKAGNNMWDSKRIDTDQMAYIRYAGKPLLSGLRYWWKVRIWDEKGRISAWSSPASFTMGILQRTEWKARWISAAGADKYALSPVGYKSADAATEGAEKWVQVDLGSLQAFSEILLYPLFYADRGGYGFPRRFKILVANDPEFKTAKTIADFTGADFNVPRYAPAHVYKGYARARYVRVAVTKLARINDGFAFALRQLMVMSAGQNIASGRPIKATDSDESNGFNKSRLTDRVRDEKASPNYSSILLRKDFKVKPRLVSAVVCVSGLSAFELTVNGKKVSKNLFSPGWTDYRKTVLYDTYNVTPQLKSGSNALGIILGNGMYNIQPDTLRYVKFINTFGPAKAIAQLRLEYADKTVQWVNTDKTWQVTPGPVTYSNLYGGEDYNANLQPKGWDKPGFKTTTSWRKAIETEGPGGVLKGLSCSAPPITAIDTLKPFKITKVNANIFIYDFGQNASMMPSLKVSGPKRSYVRLIPTELLGTDGLADRRSATQDGVRPAWWQYTLAGNGAESWFPKFFYQGARYLQVELYPSANGGLPQIEQLNDVIVHSASTPVGSFKSSNELFNKTYSLVRWAQRSNMMSFMTDCPQREKMGWLEENHLNGPALRYNFDMAPLFRKSMNDMADAQLDNGLVPNIAPEYFIAGSPALTNAFRNSAEWGSSFIIVPWQQYLFSGDISLLERYYSRMKKYLGFLSAAAKDDIIPIGLGDWYDIGPKEPWGSQLTPVSFTGTAVYYYDNWIMYRIAERLNKKEDAIAFKTFSENIKTAFNKTFYNAQTGVYATGSQTCAAMPLFFNIAEPQNRPHLLNALVKDIRSHNNSFTTGEVGYRFLLRALADEGRSDVVFDMNNQADRPGYGYQLKMGATSLTEKWDAGVGNFGSQNHFMSGQINEWFFNDLIGIRPDEAGPGFRQFVIKPALLKELDWVRGSYTAVSGDIKCEWKRANDAVTIAVTVPPNTLATIYLPTSNEKNIMEGDRNIAGAEGISLLKKDKGVLVYQLKSGSYNFTIKE
ncbi:family 78 glycoside hydrolase catalytic domain [Mucilaginibacter glaciei]|uniref:alpha-L-rhamnosidase n=1 Tax=Mucilaginibacter glaciei TaxID=2772109 RepID=A0A926S215_9SPHI|nr:family 78 glycoside hydrolase catalytic domain [Mucilaginibacter glaciei]MBD1393387.1 family 78 glycoside hydrolase catalytic domain [Mucilaginibacter glaciei]